MTTATTTDTITRYWETALRQVAHQRRQLAASADSGHIEAVIHDTRALARAVLEADLWGLAARQELGADPAVLAKAIAAELMPAYGLSANDRGDAEERQLTARRVMYAMRKEGLIDAEALLAAM